MSQETPTRPPGPDLDPGAPPPGPAHGYRVTRRGKVVGRILIGIAILTVIAIVAGIALFLHTKSLIDRSAVTCSSCTAQAGSGPMNVLVLGSDSRSVLDPQDLQHYDPSGQDRSSGQRADSIVLLHVDPGSAKAVALAFPRDLKVPAPHGGYQKINGFYNAGPSAMVRAVQQFTGLPVNHYVEVNFNSFRTITDALGGVKVRFTRAVNDPNSGLDQPAGCNLLTGDQALAFVRVRDIDSDYGRIARQQLFVKTMMEKVLSAGTLLNPQRVISLINLGASNVGHDTGLGLSTMLSLALKFRHFSSSDIDFRVVPSLPQPDGYVVANTAQSNALLTALKNGTTLPDYGRQGVSALDASGVQTTVVNGTRTAGLAAQDETILKDRGYSVIGTGTISGPAYPTTVVYYTPGNQDKAQYLATNQFPGVNVEAAPASLGVTKGDAVVVLGEDFSPAAAASVKPTANPLLPAGAAVALPATQPWFSPC